MRSSNVRIANNIVLYCLNLDTDQQVNLLPFVKFFIGLSTLCQNYKVETRMTVKLKLTCCVSNKIKNIIYERKNRIYCILTYVYTAIYN